jgi:hypothetical protein
MARLSIPQDLTFVTLLAPAADAAGRSSPYVSLKNASKAWIVFFADQANAATILLTPLQASAVAGTGAKAIAAARIWTKLDQANSDWVQAAEAATFTTDAAVKNKWVVIEIDPTKNLDVANDFDAIRISTGASNVANITSAFLIMQPKHRGATTPSVLVD